MLFRQLKFILLLILSLNHHNHAVIYETKVDRKLCNKPINMCNTDERLFASNLPQDMTTQYVNVDDFTNDVTNALYDCAATGRCSMYRTSTVI